MQTKIGAYRKDKLVLQFKSIEEVKNNGWNTSRVIDCCAGKKKKYSGMKWQYLTIPQPPKEKKEEETTNQIDMKRIQEITCIKRIDLENVKVSFPIKLLQWKINNLLYQFNNKYAFPHTISNLKRELIDIVVNSKINEEKQSEEILSKARLLYSSLHTYLQKTTIQEEQDKAIDDSIKYILFNYSKKKNVMSVTQQVEMLTEIKEMLTYISNNAIKITDRINNLFKLSQQLKESIVSQL